MTDALLAALAQEMASINHGSHDTAAMDQQREDLA
jgi:hypothetical protein